jgi:enoyl-CoA hydratase/carnithine racemase
MSISQPPAISVNVSRAMGWITLNRPHRINAINEEIRHDLPRELAILDCDPAVRVIVIEGAGERGFCVGADLKEERATTDQPPPWIEAIAAVEKPTIASIHGYCLGGGLEIAMACDLRVAAEDATFGLPEPSLGLIPGGGGTQRLPRLIGLGRALDLLLCAARIDAVEAYRIGLISRLVPQADLRTSTTELAVRISALAPLAVRLTKRAARVGSELDLSGGLALERELFARLTTTNDRREAAIAFREKREPVFTGN